MRLLEIELHCPRARGLIGNLAFTLCFALVLGAAVNAGVISGQLAILYTSGVFGIGLASAAGVDVRMGGRAVVLHTLFGLAFMALALLLLYLGAFE